MALLINLLIIHTATTAQFNPNGYCKVPVADLIGSPIKEFFKQNLSTQELYNQIPLDDRNGIPTCPRMTQLLYNDPVEILEYRNNEVKIYMPQWVYRAKEKNYGTYWTFSSNIAPLTPDSKKYHPNNIPFKTENQTIIVLDKPFYNKKTKETYSIGTRFVLASHKKSSNQPTFKVLYTKHTHKKTVDIPKTDAHIEQLHNSTEARTLFVDLLRSWVNPNQDPIPYLFGGNSWTGYENTKDTCPLTGFDCGKIITVAAQFSGIPLYASNSLTLKESCKSLKKNDTLENGDLIYFTGHIAVISDIKKGLLIEARGYKSGYGFIQEIPFSEQFKDINTTQDLLDAYFNKTKVIRYEKDHSKTQKIQGIILLKLC